MLTTLHKNKKALFGGGILVGLAALAFNGAFFTTRTTDTLLPEFPGIYREWGQNLKEGILVNEQACNGTGSYDFANVIGARDSYRVDLSSIPDNSVIKKIRIIPCASLNQLLPSDEPTAMNVFYRFNNIQSADKGNYVLTGTTPRTLYATTFDGLLLPVITSAPRASGRSDSTLEIGAVLSSGIGGARLSRIATIITYTALSE
ncbi:MAG: hypothetical protein HYT22_03380 [Candidatus Niyogibacteria bacterium]|nr:hypothetical protein [Candidatus Niyogibacteria bacterium]